MNLYKFHNEPESLDHHDLAHDSVPELFWNKYKNNPAELKKREKQIATSARCSYEYAAHTLNGPFKLGEPAIAKDAESSYDYAMYVLKRPFKLGEPAIAAIAEYSYEYSKHVLKGPFDEGEAVIAGTEYEEKYYEFLHKLRNARYDALLDKEQK